MHTSPRNCATEYNIILQDNQARFSQNLVFCSVPSAKSQPFLTQFLYTLHKKGCSFVVQKHFLLFVSAVRGLLYYACYLLFMQYLCILSFLLLFRRLYEQSCRPPLPRFGNYSSPSCTIRQNGILSPLCRVMICEILSILTTRSRRISKLPPLFRPSGQKNCTATFGCKAISV